MKKKRKVECWVYGEIGGDGIEFKEKRSGEEKGEFGEVAVALVEAAAVREERG